VYSVSLGISDPLHYANHRQSDCSSPRFPDHRSTIEMGNIRNLGSYKRIGILHLDTCSTANQRDLHRNQQYLGPNRESYLCGH
jgi:hypothetical protein